MDEQNGTLPIDGTREVADEAGLYPAGSLKHERGDVQFTDKSLHEQAVATAKAKFKVWPSAYASGYVVQHYKDLYRRKHGSLSGAFRSDGQDVTEDDLAEWFKEQWVRLTSSGEIAGPCGGRSEGEGKPKCLPKAKAEGMSKEERQRIVARKRKADPDPDRRGAAKMVSSKTDAIDPMKVEGMILPPDDEVAFISPEDVEEAVKQWKEEAPARFKDILEADNAE